MHEIGKAAMVYEGFHGTLPGYHMTVGTGADTAHVGWPVMLMPQLDHMDLWNVWEEGLKNVGMCRAIETFRRS